MSTLSARETNADAAMPQADQRAKFRARERSSSAVGASKNALAPSGVVDDDAKRLERSCESDMARATWGVVRMVGSRLVLKPRERALVSDSSGDAVARSFEVRASREMY